MQNKIEQSIIKSMDMHLTTSDNLMKLGKIVETNTDNLNLLATRLLKLEQQLNVALKAIDRIDEDGQK